MCTWVSILLSLCAYGGASPESFSACIVERKYVLTLHVQLNDRSGFAIDTGVVKIIVRIKFPQKTFKPVLNWLTVRYRPAHRFLRASAKRLIAIATFKQICTLFLNALCSLKHDFLILTFSLVVKFRSREKLRMLL